MSPASSHHRMLMKHAKPWSSRVPGCRGHPRVEAEGGLASLPPPRGGRRKLSSLPPSLSPQLDGSVCLGESGRPPGMRVEEESGEGKTRIHSTGPGRLRDLGRRQISWSQRYMISGTQEVPHRHCTVQRVLGTRVLAPDATARPRDITQGKVAAPLPREPPRPPGRVVCCGCFSASLTRVGVRGVSGCSPEPGPRAPVLLQGALHKGLLAVPASLMEMLGFPQA
ncbi:uncharacterized protein ACBT57_017299 [Dama dama]